MVRLEKQIDSLTNSINKLNNIISAKTGMVIENTEENTVSKRTFSDLRNDVYLQNAYDVATTIKDVLEANSRNVSLNVASDLVNS